MENTHFAKNCLTGGAPESRVVSSGKYRTNICKLVKLFQLVQMHLSVSSVVVVSYFNRKLLCCLSVTLQLSIQKDSLNKSPYLFFPNRDVALSRDFQNFRVPLISQEGVKL